MKSSIKEKVNEIKVSVISPIFNVEDYLEETILSLVNQTLSPIEIIMVDDGSTDNSANIIKEYAGKYKNVIYVKQDNSGPGVARNNGLQKARGEFISFVDSDDILPYDALENLYNAALSKEVDIVIGASLSFNTTETWFIKSHYDNGVYKEGYKSLITNPELLYSLGPCNKLYRRKLLEDIRFPADIKVTEDQPFVIEAYLKAKKKIYTIDKIIYKYRSRETDKNLSLSQTVRVNSSNVLNDIYNSMSISDQLWPRYIHNQLQMIETKNYYYNRLISADIWPALRNAIDSRDEKLQLELLIKVMGWLKTLDAKAINDLPALHMMMFRNIVNRYDLLSKSAKRTYLDCLEDIFPKISINTDIELRQSKEPDSYIASYKAWRQKSLNPIRLYVYKRKLSRFNLKIMTAVVRRIIFPICSKLPLQNKVVFASNRTDKMQGSFEYIYNEMIKSRPEYKVVGYFKKKRSFKEFAKLYYDIATAKYVILDDYYRPLYKLKINKRTEVIQTWHAAGAFKKFGHSAVGYRESNTKEVEIQAHSSYTKVAVTSQEIIPHYAEAFNIPEEKVYPIGLPRTDKFFNKEEMEFIRRKYEASYPALRNKKIITYAPTFRGGPAKRVNFNIQLDLKEMAKELSDEYVLILKLHPSVTKDVDIPIDAKDFALNMGKRDINDILAITDILITDYSSVIFEYALLEKPMIFFAYDLEDYLEDRGFYYDYNEFIPGPLAEKTEQVISLIQQNSFDIQKIKAFKERFFEDFDGQASKRFVETFIKPIKNDD